MMMSTFSRQQGHAAQGDEVDVETYLCLRTGCAYIKVVEMHGHEDCYSLDRNRMAHKTKPRGMIRDRNQNDSSNDHYICMLQGSDCGLSQN
jgi:hypothetical protein